LASRGFANTDARIATASGLKPVSAAPAFVRDVFRRALRLRHDQFCTGKRAWQMPSCPVAIAAMDGKPRQAAEYESIYAAHLRKAFQTQRHSDDSDPNHNLNGHERPPQVPPEAGLADGLDDIELGKFEVDNWDVPSSLWRENCRYNSPSTNQAATLFNFPPTDIDESVCDFFHLLVLSTQAPKACGISDMGCQNHGVGTTTHSSDHPMVRATTSAEFIDAHCVEVTGYMRLLAPMRKELMMADYINQTYDANYHCSDFSHYDGHDATDIVEITRTAKASGPQHSKPVAVLLMFALHLVTQDLSRSMYLSLTYLPIASSLYASWSGRHRVPLEDLGRKLYAPPCKSYLAFLAETKLLHTNVDNFLNMSTSKVWQMLWAKIKLKASIYSVQSQLTKWLVSLPASPSHTQSRL